TDAEGKFSVHVLGSDIISKDIKIKVAWKDENDNEKNVAEKECDFAEAISIRRFPNWIDPTETRDTGWLFDFPRLTGVGASTPAKIYLKHMKNPEIGDNDGNWAFVNGHRLKMYVDEIELFDGEGSIVGSEAVKEFGIIIDPNDPEAIF